MYTIVKKLNFCYGHRLLDYDGKCAHPHGHNGALDVEMVGDVLDRRGMLYDFGDVKRHLMDFIDGQLDHRMLLRKDDPLIRALESVGEGEYIFKMEENPTSENIAKLICLEGRARDLPIAAVRLWETSTSYAEYRVLSAHDAVEFSKPAGDLPRL